MEIKELIKEIEAFRNVTAEDIICDYVADDSDYAQGYVDACDRILEMLKKL